MQEMIDRYEVDAENVKVIVNIIGKKGLLKRYNLVVPSISPATKALMDTVKTELVSETSLSNAEILDPKALDSLKKKFKARAQIILHNKVPGIKKETEDYLIGMLMHYTLGLGDIEFLLNDENLEEIIINCSSEPIRVYHKKYGWLETDVIVDDETDIQNYANIIARRVGRQINTLSPLLDAHLLSGDRANAVLYPIANKGNTITIRKFSRDPWTMVDLIKNKTCSSEVFALIWLMIQYEMNILISGGTGSGKTSFLNVCLPFIPPNQRIISIEDTRELQLPKYMYWCPLTTRQANAEGKGEVSMINLLVNSLRMRPDRIILGEIRKKEEAQVLFEAMHTGHSVYSTLHADSMSETISRLTYPPISIAPNLLKAVHLNIVMFRDRRKGIRRIYQMGEFIESVEENKVGIKSNVLFRLKPGTDEIVKHGDTLNLFENISKHTGLNQKEIEDNLRIKMNILEYLAKNNITKIEDVGKVMLEYYTEPDFVIDIVKNEKDKSLLIKK